MLTFCKNDIPETFLNMCIYHVKNPIMPIALWYIFLLSVLSSSLLYRLHNIYIYYIYVYLYIVYENKIVENPSESTTGRPMSRRAPLRHPMPRLAQTAASALILMETIEQRLGYERCQSWDLRIEDVWWFTIWLWLTMGIWWGYGGDIVVNMGFHRFSLGIFDPSQTRKDTVLFENGVSPLVIFVGYHGIPILLASLLPSHVLLAL